MRWQNFFKKCCLGDVAVLARAMDEFESRGECDFDRLAEYLNELWDADPHSRPRIPPMAQQSSRMSTAADDAQWRP
jgi:hypothetical protein